MIMVNIKDAFFERHGPKFTEQARKLLDPCLQVLEFPKKHLLVKEGQTNNLVYLMIQGAARSYYLKEGREINTWFAFENDVVGSLRNYQELPSRETIELLEDSVLLAFDIKKIKPLMLKNVEISNLVNNAIKEYSLYLEDKFFFTHLRTAKEKYDALIANEPDTFQRVPLTYIASYLGISRETLSRLRAK